MDTSVGWLFFTLPPFPVTRSPGLLRRYALSNEEHDAYNSSRRLRWKALQAGGARDYDEAMRGKQPE